MKKHILILFFLIYNSVSAQDQYTDFHTHITTKHYYRDINTPFELVNQDGSERTAFGKKGLDSLNWIPFGYYSKAKRKAKESNYANYDQADFSELKKVQGSILCNSFYPFEKLMALKGFDRLINHLLVSRISLARLRKIASNENSPFKEFMAEYVFAKKQSETVTASTAIKFARDSIDLASNIKNNITSYILTIEGAQVLSDSIAANTKNIRDFGLNESSDKEILYNVSKLKNLDHRLFFITISHFSWNRVAGFAKTLDKKGFRRKAIAFLSLAEKNRARFFFKPGEGIHGKVGISGDSIIGSSESCECDGCLDINGTAITDTKGNPIRPTVHTYTNEFTIGRKVIAAFLNPDNSVFHKPTYIDIKHMDILARMQYYEMRDSLSKLYNINIPIIASHIAVSGENLGIAAATGLFPNFDKYAELSNPKAYYDKQISDKDCEWKIRNNGIDPFKKMDTSSVGWFYPWSINLYDEEIEKIHESDGIMGIMLDGRQLGQDMNNYTKSYKKNLKKEFDKINYNYRYNNFLEYYEVEPFLRNVIYIAKHCGKSECWDHISLGSDFDGLIHPMKICPTTESIPVFKKKLVDYFTIYLKLHQAEVQLASTRPIEDIVEKIFSTNGKRFIVKYF